MEPSECPGDLPGLPPSPRWAVPLLLLAGALAYANSFGGAFVADDRGSILLNPHVRHLWPPWESMQAPLDETASGRPLVAWSLALNFALDGLETRGYHAFNLAVHLLVALVLWDWLRRTLTLPSLRERWGARAGPFAFAVTLLWIVHPLTTEAVTYVVQRAESMTALCALLTLWAALRAATETRPARWRALAVAACACGMACKESMVVVPVAVFLYDGLLVHPSFAEAWRRRRGFYAALASTWLLLAGLVAGAPRPTSTGAGEGVVSSWEYLRSQAGILLHYLRLVVWPHPQVLLHDWPVARSVSDWLPHGLAVLALLGAAVVAVRRRLPAAFPMACCFLLLAPTSTVMPLLDLCAERRMYLPLTGVLAMIVGFLDTLLPRRRGLRPVLLAAAAVLLGALTVRRNEMYRDEDRLVGDTLVRTPTSARTWNNRAVRFVRLGRLEEAERDYRQALDLDPGLALAHANLGTLLHQRGRTEEGLAHLHQALRLAPDYASAHQRLGSVLLAQGRFDDAREHYREAVRLEPLQVAAQYGLALILEAEGRAAEAADRYRAALEVPWIGTGEARDRLARLLATHEGLPGRDEAVGHAERAVGERASARRLDTLGMAYAAAGRFRQAGESAGRAAEAARAEGDEGLAGRIDERRAAYAAGRPVTGPQR